MSFEIRGLPPDWAQATTGDGRIVYINHRTRTTTYVHPKLRERLLSTLKRPLPAGWEIDLDADGEIYFIDHEHGHTQREPPWVTAKTAALLAGREVESSSVSGRDDDESEASDASEWTTDSDGEAAHHAALRETRPRMLSGASLHDWDMHDGDHTLLSQSLSDSPFPPPPRMPGRAPSAALLPGPAVLPWDGQFCEWEQAASPTSDAGYARSVSGESTASTPFPDDGRYDCNRDADHLTDYDEDDGYSGLPSGWVEERTVRGVPYFVHQTTRRVTWCDPRIALEFGIDAATLPPQLDLDMDEHGLFLVDRDRKFATRDLSALSSCTGSCVSSPGSGSYAVAPTGSAPMSAVSRGDCATSPTADHPPRRRVSFRVPEGGDLKDVATDKQGRRASQQQLDEAKSSSIKAKLESIASLAGSVWRATTAAVAGACCPTSASKADIELISVRVLEPRATHAADPLAAHGRPLAPEEIV
eukprot:m.248979 g.248979  ORF g.248979 m.248979 type:complete len:473 (-) comp63951_c0_seq1:193-1611(-)